MPSLGYYPALGLYSAGQSNFYLGKNLRHPSLHLSRSIRVVSFSSFICFQFTAIGVLMVSALAASAPYDTYYAPQYYYQPRPVQPFYYTPEAYAGQYVFDRQQYVPSPVVYRYVRSAQQEPAFNQPQSAALENRRAGPPPPPPPGHA